MKDALGHGSDPRGGNGSRYPVAPHAGVKSVGTHPAKVTHGGFTVDQHGLAPTRGYMVSEPGRERVIPGNPTAGQEVAFMRANRSLLSRPGEYLGKWIEKGKSYLDVSRDIPRRADAIKAAHASHQLGIFDVARGRTISTP